MTTWAALTAARTSAEYRTSLGLHISRRVLAGSMFRSQLTYYVAQYIGSFCCLGRSHHHDAYTLWIYHGDDDMVKIRP
jgi:hypothetical protein